MLSRPTTDQLILDCRSELLSTIDGALSDATAKVAVQMMENVLRNCAERAAHEIAWMREEGDAMVDFADAVAKSAASTPAVEGAIAAYHAKRTDSLHLDDVATTYSLAGECLSAGLEAAMAAGDDDLHRQGRAVLDLRLAHEEQIMGEWTMVGRA